MAPSIPEAGQTDDDYDDDDHDADVSFPKLDQKTKRERLAPTFYDRKSASGATTVPAPMRPRAPATTV